VLFALALLVLLASAALLVLRPEPSARAPLHLAHSPTGNHDFAPRSAAARMSSGEDLPPRSALPGTLSGGRRAIAEAARRFMAAFLRYEVGDAPPSVLAELRAASTEELAAQLFLAPPRPTATDMPRRARLIGLEVSLPGGAAPEALVSGALRREGSIEAFAFLFEREGQRWLASGVEE
jgi:hypothetical protein